MVVLLLLEGALLAAQPTLESASASDDPQPEHPPTELRLVLEDAPAGFNESFRDALSKQNIEATSEEIDGTLTLTIKPWSGPGVDGFSYELALSREGERVGEVFSQVCVGCDGPALALEAADRAIVMTERLPRREKPRVPELVEEVSLAPAMPIPDAPRRSFARPLVGIGGSGVIAGCVMLGVGGALLARGEVVEPDSMNEAYLRITDYRPPGVALVVSGGIALAAGAVLSGVGIYLWRRGRGRSRHARRFLPRIDVRSLHVGRLIVVN